MESGSLNEGIGNNHNVMVMITHGQCLVVILASLLIHTLAADSAQEQVSSCHWQLRFHCTLDYHFSPKSGELKSQCTALKVTDLCAKLEFYSGT